MLERRAQNQATAEFKQPELSSRRIAKVESRDRRSRDRNGDRRLCRGKCLRAAGKDEKRPAPVTSKRLARRQP
jgi:hypothetical protein